MGANKYNNPFIEEFNERLTEFERKIEEDEYGSLVEGFENEYSELKEDCQNLFDECYDEDEITIVEDFQKRLGKIDEEYDEEDMRNFLLPDKDPNSDDDLDDGFSTDKYFGLDE